MFSIQSNKLHACILRFPWKCLNAAVMSLQTSCFYMLDEKLVTRPRAECYSGRWDVSGLCLGCCSFSPAVTSRKNYMKIIFTLDIPFLLYNHYVKRLPWFKTHMYKEVVNDAQITLLRMFIICQLFRPRI